MENSGYMRLRGAAGIAFMAMFAVLTIAFFPGSLLYPRADFDSRWIRAVVAVPMLAAALAGLVFSLKKKRTEGAVWSSIAGLCGLIVVMMPPACHGYGFAIALPALLLLIPFSFGILTTSRITLPKAMILPALGFSVVILVKLFTGVRDIDLVLPFLSFVWLPVAAATAFREKRLTHTWVESTAIVVYLFSVVYGSLQVFTGMHPSPPGTSGNPNWLSCTLVGVVPWVGSAVTRALKNRSVGPRFAVLIGWGLTLGPAGFVLWKCQTRALFLVLAVGCAVWVLVVLKKVLLRIIWCVACLGIVMYAGQRYASRVRNAVAQDVRLPLWSSCIRLATQYPILGLSPRDVQRELPDILAESQYHTRFVASEWMEHPHNELLNVALNLGIPATVAWAFLLLPLLKFPRKDERHARIAWFSASFMILLGMADKGLAMGPAVVFFPICLGIRWAPFLEARDNDGGKLVKTGEVGALSMAVASLVMAIYLGHASLTAQWWNRRGNQVRGAGYFREAKRLYEKGLAAQPADFDTAYTIAALSLQKISPFDPVKTGQELQRVYAMNPNFSHVNRLMGRYWLTMGEREKGRQFLLRDMELFPENVLSSHWLVYALLREDQPKHLLDAEKELYRRLHGRIRAFTDFTNQDSLLVMWLAAMTEGRWTGRDGDDALSMCTRLTSRLVAHDYVDPICPWNIQQSWPSDFIGLKPTEMDVPFWKSVLFREAFYDERFPEANVNTLRDGKADTDGEYTDVWSICKIIYDHVEFTKEESWSFPHETWDNARANWDAGYSLLAWLYPGMVLMVVPETQGGDAEALVIPPQGSAMSRMGVAARVNMPKRTIEFLDDAAMTEFTSTNASRLRLAVLPHEYLTRTHAYHAVASKVASYRKNLRFGGIPGVPYAILRERYPSLPRYVAPWEVPCRAVLRGTQATP